MMKYAVLLLCAASALAAPPKSSPITLKDLYSSTVSFEARIIDGSVAERGQFPWQASVLFQTNDGMYTCGGSLINDRWVLTAAHCAEGANTFWIGLGGLRRDDSEDSRIELITNTAVIQYSVDIALIRLNDPVGFTDTIQPIRLPARNDRMGAGVTVRVSGWGQTSSGFGAAVLNWVDLTTISNEKCAETYGYGTIHDLILCAVGNPQHSTCFGDSGGPLVHWDDYGPVLHGVISFVSTRGCASGDPSGYASTEPMLDWIRDVTGMNV